MFIEINLESSDGRGSKIRTCDPLFPKQVRYQTALYPDTEFGLDIRVRTKRKGLVGLCCIFCPEKFMGNQITGFYAQI